MLTSMDLAHNESPRSIEMDPAYANALGFIQQGRWAEAAEAVAQLERRYPASTEVLELRQRLAFHLSAEETWSAEKKRLLPRPLRPVGVRVLLIANLLVYLLLALGWLVGEWMGLLGQASLR